MRSYEAIDLHLISPTSTSKISRTNSQRLSVVVAGFGYNFDMPLLYFSRMVLEEQKNDILLIDFGYSKDSRFLQLPDKEKELQFESDIESVRKYVHSSKYKELVLIGKSIGTTVCHHILQDPIISQQAIGAIWLTPAQSAEDIGREIPSNDMANLLVIGSADRYSENLDTEYLSRRTNVTLHIVPDGNHSLETKNSIDSIDVLRRILNQIVEFLRTL